ncbi:MAG: hypothetical protein CMJ90_19465 [Planctomycetes bacterium]|nr:hypothetical protein [Planctomycetota bacterium]
MRAIYTLWISLCAATLSAQEAQRPNVLFLFADDLRPDAIGSFGNPHIKTPHIDTLVKRGFRFERNYCMGSIHGAVCQPSRAMLMSGRSLYRVNMKLQGIPTLGQVLGQSGYDTFGTGKWHNGGPSFLKTFRKGRAVMLGGMSDHTKVPIQDVKADGTFTKRRTAKKFSSALFVDETIAFLEGRGDAEDPFFAYVAFTAPHDPRQPPEPYRKMYYEARPPLPKNFMPQHPFHNGWMTGRDESLAAWPRTRSVVSDQLCEYYGLITHMDDQIGRLLQALERTGRTKDTIVVFAADHGLAVGSHGLLGKQSVYEHSMGCPLVIAGPGVPQGSSRAFTYLYDLMPTLLDVAGVKAPDGVEGKNLRPVWTGTSERVRDSVYLTYENKMRAVRDDRYKLIRYPLIDHEQLFDLQEDPDELVNLATRPEHKERRAQLSKLLGDWHQRMADPHPLKVKRPRSMEIDLTGRKRKPDRHQPEWIREKYFKKQEAPKPNLLLMMVDDLGPEWISACGGGFETPHIDSIAHDGARFTNAYSMPKCTPTRVTLLTGQYPFRHGWVNHWDVPRWGAGCHFDPKHNPTFAQALRAAGYRTAIAGKWQINDFRVQPDVLAAHGFEDWCMWTGGEGGNPKSNARYQDPYVHTKGGSKLHKGAFGPDLYTDFLISFMKQHKDEPMLLYYPMALTHGPLIPTPLDPEAKGKMPRHRAMVRYTDHLVGRLLGAIDDLGLARRTLVVFTTDNGTAGGITGRLGDRDVKGGKGRMREAGCRAPFFARWPGQVPAGRVVPALTDFTDLYPTLLELAGASAPKGHHVDGHSLVDPLLGFGNKGRRDWIMAMGGGVARQQDGRVVPARPRADRVLRDARFKLWVTDGSPTRLHDLRVDPEEQHNLMASERPDAVKARDRLVAAAATFPARDAHPRYDPLPAQPWDRKAR